MATSPPPSPLPQQRPMSVIARSGPRSSSRMSMSSKNGGSKASDEDSRTAVRVAVRVRPPLQPTDPGFELIPQRFQRSSVHVTSDTNIAIDSPQGKKLFVFDRVFNEQVMQDGIWSYLEDSVNSFVQGYNVSLLAYGQSGAGKSYTMGTSGPLEQYKPETMGVIPRAAYALFDRLDPTPKKGNRASLLRNPNPRFSHSPSASNGTGSANGANGAEKNWSLKATYLEIYNESLRDLLLPENIPQGERAVVTVREDTKGNILLTGLRQVDINSVEDLMNALNFGSSIRQTDATAVNAKSSRSHAVFTLNLVQRKSKTVPPSQTPQNDKRLSTLSTSVDGLPSGETWVTTDSKLHFVDLAGSERLKNTGAQGERAKEGISINAGLAALGKVISQLSSRQAGSHVSYRDSKLTRLLQDSLGGNAITYMIACVTQAEFHLSETLNTVQYAQRARAIQSKPRIQATEEGDKQAIIDRLKAEVAFLRDQIRSAEQNGSGGGGGGGSGFVNGRSLRLGAAGDRRSMDPGDRSERQSEREVELQNQLLDTQENYSSLSQRHANLIAELAKARDLEASANAGDGSDPSDDSATERLNRSNSFAQAVEQVVLEYEKTIQSLEQSLSSTRGSLSNTETSLLEKEAKCAYVETINSQLQLRLQKLMDREASTETYLHDLESRLDGHTSGEEKNAVIVIGLRKEIARARENEASCEEYISTLEERLAEADQDAELMQREMDKMAQVIERQRSLGKLDSLLRELDQIHEDRGGDEKAAGSAGGRRSKLIDHARTSSVAQPPTAHAIPEEEEGRDSSSNDGDDDTTAPTLDGSGGTNPNSHHSSFSPTEAQSKLMTDRLEMVTQELVHLRVEHETTLHDFNSLNAKYEDAMRSISEMQDALDEVRHPNKVRDSVISLALPIRGGARSSGEEPAEGSGKGGLVVKHPQQLSRSLSSELLSAMEVPPSPSGPLEPDESEPTSAAAEAADREFRDELERLKALATEREVTEKELSSKYTELEGRHHAALDMIEDLRTEISKARAVEASSPRSGQPVIRRKSSQNVMIIDRAHRSFASLRNIATENFENNPDVMQNFELNLNSAMHELHARSERIQELEADVTAARKEMESKMTIIAGLTRERSSMKASSSPLDMAMVSGLRQQLELSEAQLQQERDMHEARQQELTVELESLRKTLQNQNSVADEEERTTDAQPTDTPTSEGQEEIDTQAVGAEPTNKERRIADLEEEVSSWETRHQEALDNLQAVESAAKAQMEKLEAELASVNAAMAEAKQSRAAEATTPTAAAVDVDADAAATKQENLIKYLRNEIDEYKAIINSNATRIAELEQKHAAAQSAVESAAESDRDLVLQLEAQMESLEQARRSHEESAEALRVTHQKEIEQIKTTEQRGYEQQMEVLLTEHAEAVRSLECELGAARDDLMKVATQVAFAMGLEVSVEKLTERIDDLVSGQKALADVRERRGALEKEAAELGRVHGDVVRDLEQVRQALAEVLHIDGGSDKAQAPVGDHLELLRRRMGDLESENNRNSRIVQQLEEQLASTFDEAQATNNRLSTLAERNAKLEEVSAARARLQGELDTVKEDLAVLQTRYNEVASQQGGGVQRSDSATGHGHGGNATGPLRKSSSVTSLPSPPPSVPLPPLPGLATLSSAAAAASASRPTSPTTTTTTTTHGHRPASKDQLVMAQIQEDQEARILSIEKNLKAEKTLNTVLEESLNELERTSTKLKQDSDQWRRRAEELEAEIRVLRERAAQQPQQQEESNRLSLLAVEEERRKREVAEAARRRAEERMQALSQKKKKKASLNCF